MKIWTNEEPGNDKIIAYMDKTIYKGNPKTGDIYKYTLDLEMRNVSSNTFLGIPLNYIKQIKMQEGKEYIEVLFGKSSSEHLRIKNSTTRNEVFEYFKQNIPGRYTIEKYSKLQAGKKPLIAMVVVMALFLWSLYYAVNIEGGITYTVSNGLSLTGIVLSIAYLGVTKVIMIFSFLFAIAASSFFLKIKKPPVIQLLLVN